jgi:hypothetical protein
VLPLLCGFLFVGLISMACTLDEYIHGVPTREGTPVDWDATEAAAEEETKVAARINDAGNVNLQEADTETPTPGPSPTPGKNFAEIQVYGGPDELSWYYQKTCVGQGEGFLYLNPDGTAHLDVVGPDFSATCKLLGGKMGTDLFGTYNLARHILNLTRCGNPAWGHATGTGKFSDTEASGEFTCFDNGSGDKSVTVKFTFKK